MNFNCAKLRIACLFLLAALFFLVVDGRPQQWSKSGKRHPSKMNKPSPHHMQDYWNNPYNYESRTEEKMMAPSSDVGYHHSPGRVKIQVYRGKSTKLDHKEEFAPWGYYVKLPADDYGKKHF